MTALNISLSSIFTGSPQLSYVIHSCWCARKLKCMKVKY